MFDISQRDTATAALCFSNYFAKRWNLDDANTYVLIVRSLHCHRTFLNAKSRGDEPQNFGAKKVTQKSLRINHGCNFFGEMMLFLITSWLRIITNFCFEFWKYVYFKNKTEVPKSHSNFKWSVDKPVQNSALVLNSEMLISIKFIHGDKNLMGNLN